MSPVKAIGHALRNYVNFTGRAARSEFWWFLGFYLVLSVIAQVLDVTFGWHLTSSRTPCPPNAFCADQDFVREPGWIFDLIVEAALFIPLLSLMIRRLHDTEHRWAWSLIYFIPYLVSSVYGYVYLISGATGSGIISLILNALAVIGAVLLLPFMLEPTLRHGELAEDSALPVTEIEEEQHSKPGVD